ncbi:RNA-directed DNA polymerase, eukaryota [Tanacetum coccineum]
MSKLDRFYVSNNLFNTCPHISAITLDRYLSDHRPILLRETDFDFKSVPFRFFHHCLELEWFTKFVSETWNIAPVDTSNGMRNMMGKLKFLKCKIQVWVNSNRCERKVLSDNLKKELRLVDEAIDKGSGTDVVVQKRVQSFFHGMLNKKRNQTNIRGIMVDGVWKDHPSDIKKEFLLHFQNRFDKPAERRAIIEMCYPRSLSSEQRDEIEREVTKEELKTAVWDCGTDKSPGPDGYTFGFYRKFWSIIENDVYAAVKHFFNHGDIPAGCNASFIALIPKIPDANLVKDFRPICLLGSIIRFCEIWRHRLVVVLGDIVNEVQSAFIAGRQILDGPFILNEVLHWCNKKKKKSLIFKVDFEKAYDSVRWDFLDDVLKKFGFGNKWCNWIQCCLKSSRGSILVNGSPTDEFQFFKGLKQGDPLSPFLFILIMESLHLSFQRVIDAGLFKGINLNHSLCLSHMFYADDAVFVGQWSDGNINIFDPFCVALFLSCFSPFSFLGTKVGEAMSRIQAWKEVVEKSSIEGPSCVGIYKRSLLNGHEMGSNKGTWVKWNYVLTDKKHGGLGVSSLYALNRGLMIKWGWIFFTQKESLWAKVITAIHGDYDKVESRGHALGNGDTSRFWTDRWYAGGIIKDLCPCLFALDNCKEIFLDSLAEVVRSINLVSSADRWIWNLESSGEFSVASARKKIDVIRFPIVKDATRWVKCVPIKVNILAWKIRNDALPTRFNISRRGIDIQSISCPICKNGVESSEHLFFKCYLIREIGCKIASWWNINYVEVNLYEEWKTWLISCRMESKLKQMFEADVELANNLLHELNRYLEQLRTRAPEMLKVEAIPDDPLIKYGFNALERRADRIMRALSIDSIPYDPLSLSF